MSRSSVCEDCRHCKWEEITDGLWEQYCEEDMESFNTDEGCYQFWRKEDEDE